MQGNKLALERIVFLGRTFDEYVHMFSLSDEVLKGKKILDCPAGACSFTTIGNQKGLDITACDIAYYHSVRELEHKGLEDINHAMFQMEKVKGKYKWSFFKTIEELRKHRKSALHNCVADMVTHPERYNPVTLPSMPFKDNEFDILLSAHFLFMYADRLDYDFHLSTIKEMLRVTKEEIRIFPIVDLEGNRYEHLDRLYTFLHERGCSVEEKVVPYEFQENANMMLVIKKNKPS